MAAPIPLRLQVANKGDDSNNDGGKGRGGGEITMPKGEAIQSERGDNRYQMADQSKYSLHSLSLSLVLR